MSRFFLPLPPGLPYDPIHKPAPGATKTLPMPFLNVWGITIKTRVTGRLAHKTPPTTHLTNIRFKKKGSRRRPYAPAATYRYKRAVYGRAQGRR